MAQWTNGAGAQGRGGAGDAGAGDANRGAMDGRPREHPNNSLGRLQQGGLDTYMKV